MYVAPLGDPLDLSKPIHLFVFGSFWAGEALSNMLTCIVSTYHFWKRLGVRVMSIFGSHVGPRNIHW